MNDILTIVLYSSAAGLTIIIGALLSHGLRNNKRFRASGIPQWVVAFGGGSLFSAIAFALVPRALESLPLPVLVMVFAAGTASFMFMDILISRLGTSLAQAFSMMMDFIPEALALGASFAYDHRFGLLLAIFIGLQNLPEGFNSYIELTAKMKRSSALFLMLGLSFTGIFAAMTGFTLLRDRPALIAGILLYAAGGIIYLIFQDIAPLSRRKNDWVPATGASMGFLLGIVGEKILL